MTAIFFVVFVGLAVAAFFLSFRVVWGSTSLVRDEKGQPYRLADSWPLKLYKMSGFIDQRFAVRNTVVRVCALAHGGQGGPHQKIMILFTTEQEKAIWGVDMTPENARVVGKALIDQAEYFEAFQKGARL